jgi:hypothetical protein
MGGFERRITTGAGEPLAAAFVGKWEIALVLGTTAADHGRPVDGVDGGVQDGF